MLSGLRAEFPSLDTFGERIRAPRIAHEPLWWAFLSAVGAGVLVHGVVSIVLMPLYPAVFPATEPHPDWLTPAAISDVAASIAIGAVAMRAGGIIALGAYVAYELLRLLAAVPGRALFCERSGAQLGQPSRYGCDYPSLVTEHWPVWLALALGVLVAPVLSARGGDANWTLRGAGAFSVAISVFGSAIGLAFQGGFDVADINRQNTVNGLFMISELVAGALAGVVLGRARLAAAVLVAITLFATGLAFSVPIALRGGAPADPPEFALTRWLGVLMPVVAMASLFAARAYVLRRTRGTFF